MSNLKTKHGLTFVKTTVQRIPTGLEFRMIARWSRISLKFVICRRLLGLNCAHLGVSMTSWHGHDLDNVGFVLEHYRMYVQSSEAEIFLYILGSSRMPKLFKTEIAKRHWQIMFKRTLSMVSKCFLLMCFILWIFCVFCKHLSWHEQ